MNKHEGPIIPNDSTGFLFNDFNDDYPETSLPHIGLEPCTVVDIYTGG